MICYPNYFLSTH